jgi:DNA-binding NtrC family response regulator
VLLAPGFFCFVEAHITACFADIERESMSTSRSTSPSLTFSPPEPGTSFAAWDKSGLVGSSTAMKRLRQQVRRIGPHFRTVLVGGEPGTGKELVARVLHSMSPASEGPLVVCRAPDVKDALTEHGGRDCTADDLGLLMKGSVRGTLFLDRINELPLDVQGRLLRALTQYDLTQNRLDISGRIDLRIIASTDEDVRILVSTGRLNQELYQRLATVDITLPPLRERIEDLPELARHFLERFASLYEKAVREIADEAMKQMLGYLWPGNVGEVEIVLRNGVLQSEGEVLQPHHLPSFSTASRHEQSTAGAGKSVRLQDVIEQHVLRVLKDCRGNKLRASDLLGISRSTLYRMLDAGVSADTWR